MVMDCIAADMAQGDASSKHTLWFPESELYAACRTNVKNPHG